MNISRRKVVMMKGQVAGVLEQDSESDSRACGHVYSTVFKKQKQIW